MSTLQTTPAGVDHDHHDPHLAHHFESTQQQMSAAKLGMWVFLGTEILMFGGLFCAYSVYRYNQSDVFEFAHRFLDKKLGGINTAVLITSSLTMAWAVRLAQLGKSAPLRICLALTLLGGFGFMGIKSLEYRLKWQHHLFPGPSNLFHTHPHDQPLELENEQKGAESVGRKVSPAFGLAPPPGSTTAPTPALTPATALATTVAALRYDAVIDPNNQTADVAKIKLPQLSLNQQVIFKPEVKPSEMTYEEMSDLDKDRISTFFGIYFVMTGLHGVHVLVGMGLIFWILMRSLNPRQKLWALPAGLGSIGLFLVFVGVIAEHQPTLVLGIIISLVSAVWAVIRLTRGNSATAKDNEGEFGPDYFAPVDIVGLYWHLVDLIWIFLFPLLYLIH